MSHHHPDVNTVIDAVPGRVLPASVSMASMAAIAAGLGAFAYGLFASEGGAPVAWGAWLVGTIYLIGISQGGVMFSVIQSGTLGRWGRPLKRVAEAFGLFLPVAWVLLLVFLVAGLKIYPWHPETWAHGGPVALAPHSAEAPASKEMWLTPVGFVVRNLALAGLLFGLSFVYLRASLRPDLMLAAARLGSKAPSWWSWFTSGGGDVSAEVDAGQRRQRAMVPLMGMSYALLMSFLAFDLLMSLAPWWVSNMFGGWIFMSSFWLSLAFLALFATAGLDWLGLRGWVSSTTTHTLGRMMLAGTMFWGYTTFGQLLPIWYTNMPEETDYLLVRMYLPQWQWMSQTVAVMCFIAPFTMLLSRGVKKMRWPLAGVAAMIAVGVFMERTLLVLPQTWWGDHFPVMDFVVVCGGVWIGFVGLFVQVVGRILASMPAIPVSDPQLEEHPWDVHVHAPGATAAHH